MPALSEYSNVHNTCVSILLREGYQVWSDADGSRYWAEKDGWDFCADSPTGLLGLVAIFEKKRPARYAEYWWREQTTCSYRQLPQEPQRPYRPVYLRDKNGGRGDA